MSIEKLFGSFYKEESLASKGLTLRESLQGKKKKERPAQGSVKKQGFFAALSRLRPSYWLGRARLSKKLYYYTLIGLILLVGGGIAYFQFLHPGSADAAWFNDNWLYRRSIAITAHTAAENNVYINLTGAAALDTSDTTKLQADCGDLRFTDYSGNLLQYFIVSGCGTSSTVIHVNFETFPAGAQDIYYYYGNPSAANGFSSTGFPKAATGVTIGSFGSEENSPAPAAYWAFDDGQGTRANDSTGNGKYGTLSGTTLPVWTSNQCVSQKCLFFNGITSNVSVPGTVAGVKTIAFWVNPSASNSAELMALNSLVDVRASGGTITTPWVTSPTIYVNGVVSSTLTANTWNYITVTTSTAISASAITLGKGPLGVLKGYLDEAKFYPFVLTASQIQANYNARGSSQGAGSVLGVADQAYLSKGLVGYWKMDETAADTCTGASNDSCDSSGNVRDGLWNGSATASSSAKFAAGTTFASSTSDYISVASPGLPTTDFTYSTWVKLIDDSSSDDTILMASDGSGGNELFIYITSGGGVQMSLNSTQVINGSVIPLNTWSLLTFTRVGSEVKYYINGVLNSTGSNSDILNFSTCSLFIGVDIDGTCSTGLGNYLDGVLDEVRIYNRGLSADEVANLYNFAPGPVGYWDFENGTTTTVTDRAGTQNGTWVGAGSNRYAIGKFGKAGNFFSTTDGVSFPYNATLAPSHYTVEAWVKMNSVFNNSTAYRFAGTLYSGGSDGFMIGKTNSASTFFASWGTAGTSDSITSNTLIVPEKWYHVAATFDDTAKTVTLYINGVKEKSKVTTYTPSTSIHLLCIGATSGCSIGNFAGKIDEVKVYSYPRTQKQIVEDMSANHPAGNANSTIGYWKFDTGYGNVASNSGSLAGAADGRMFGFSSPASVISGWTNDGKFGKALNFDGTTNLIDAGSAAGFDDMAEFSVSAWINPRSIGEGSAGRIVDKANATTPTSGWNLQLTATNALKFMVDYSTTDLVRTTSNNVVSLSNWQHAVVTWDGSTTASNVQIFVNGKEVTYQTTTNGSGTRVTDAAESFKIGNDKSRAATFDGWIDEVKVYNYVLAPSEVKLDFNHGSSLVLGSFGMDSNGVASNSASAVYCVPGDTTQVCAPVGEWRFEERQGLIANDTSGNNSNGPFFRGSTTNPAWTTGKIGSSLYFDGTNYVKVGNPSVLQITGNLSVSAWFNHSSSGGTATAGVDKNGMYRLAVVETNQSTSRFVFAITIGASLKQLNSTFYTNDTWHHVEGTYDGSIMRIYVDGKLAGTRVESGSIDNTGSNFCIGTRDSCGSALYVGKIDEVKVYNYAQSAAQVAWNYNRGKPQSYLKFDECQGSTLHDSIGTMSATLNLGSAGITTVGTCATASTAWGNGASGKFSYSLDLDGTDDAMYALSPGLPTNDFTASAWVNLGTATDETILMASKTGGDELRVHVNSSGQIELYTAGVLRATSARALSTGSWANVVVASSSGTQKIYINGTQDSNTGSGTTQMNFGGCSLWIGADVDSGCGGSLANYMDGQIDDVQVFSYPLTQVQIRNLYNQSAAVRFGPLTGAP